MYNVNNCEHECECDCKEPLPPKKTLYSSDAPYPPIQICERNSMYGRMMLDNVGGENSEMTAVSLYLYNNLLIDDNEFLSTTFKKISIVEMHHLHIFGQIARLMGENPRLWTHRRNQMAYWSPGYNQYPLELKPLLLNMLESEKKAVQKYENQCGKIQDIHIVACLRRVIEDEMLHIGILNDLYQKYC